MGDVCSGRGRAGWDHEYVISFHIPGLCVCVRACALHVGHYSPSLGMVRIGICVMDPLRPSTRPALCTVGWCVCTHVHVLTTCTHISTTQQRTEVQDTHCVTWYNSATDTHCVTWYNSATDTHCVTWTTQQRTHTVLHGTTQQRTHTVLHGQLSNGHTLCYMVQLSNGHTLCYMVQLRTDRCTYSYSLQTNAIYVRTYIHTYVRTYVRTCAVSI